MAGAVEVQGLKELQRGLHAINRDVDKELRAELGAIAQPVASLAGQLAGREVHNLLSPTAAIDWWKMRVGFSSGVVYIAPATRRTVGTRRPNLAGLLERPMQEAVDTSEPAIRAGIERVLGELITKYG